MNISNPEFTYEPDDPEGFRSGLFRVGKLVGAARTGMSAYELPPGQAICPYHYEHAEEEWLLVLAGMPTLRTPEGSRRLEPWDVAFFPTGPDGAHGVRNETAETVRVLMFSNVVHPGATVYLDSDKIGVWTGNKADDAPEATLTVARRLATRLQRHGIVGLSSFYADPAELGRAIQEAELVLDVLRRSDVPIAEEIGTGTYRLLFRVLASHPEEVRSFYDDTVAPIVAYDDQYATDLVGTLEAYLEQNCNMNATAATIYAHRHTVAYRLERVKELTGLDPMVSEDRERLGLGLKAYRIIAPRLPR